MPAEHGRGYQRRDEQDRTSGHEQQLLGKGILDRGRTFGLLEAENTQVGIARVLWHKRCRDAVDAAKFGVNVLVARQRRKGRSQALRPELDRVFDILV